MLQRCIDHASESQKIQLVTEITYNALTLVQVTSLRALFALVVKAFFFNLIKSNFISFLIFRIHLAIMLFNTFWILVTVDSQMPLFANSLVMCVVYLCKSLVLM